MADYFLIAGLGNPSGKYEKTRHNAGFWFVDQVAANRSVGLGEDSRFSGLMGRFDCEGRSVLLLKPQTFMNRSGLSVGAVCRYFKIPPTHMLVVHDELDFPAGTARLKVGGGHGGHNGLRDIIAHLGDNGFARLRIGIGHPGDRSRVMQYVLDAPSGEDRQAIEFAIERSAKELGKIVSGRIGEAMNSLHGD